MICDRRVGPTSYNEREGDEAGSETSNAIRVGGGGTDEKTGGGDGVAELNPTSEGQNTV